jgi:hypothetical protein
MPDPISSTDDSYYDPDGACPSSAAGVAGSYDSLSRLRSPTTRSAGTRVASDSKVRDDPATERTANAFSWTSVYLGCSRYSRSTGR